MKTVLHAPFWQGGVTVGGEATLIDSSTYENTATSVSSRSEVPLEISAIAPRSASEGEEDKLFKHGFDNVSRGMRGKISWPPRFQAARAVAAKRIAARFCTTRRRAVSTLVLQAAARAVAAKLIAACLRPTERAFSPALAVPVLQASAQAFDLVSLCPTAWILLTSLVAVVGAFGASRWWRLAPRFHQSAAGRSRCAQSAARFLGIAGGAAFEKASRQARSGRSSSRRRNRVSSRQQFWPLAMFLIVVGFGSCAAYQFAPAPTRGATRGSQPPAAPNSPTGGTLSMVAASISTETFTAPPSDVAPLVLHGRHLNQVSASTVSAFTAAVADSTVNKILLAAGTYNFNDDTCTGSAVCISRALTIEAEVPGAVVLNAMGGRRVFTIESGGTAELIGLNITGGSSTGVHSARPLNLL